MKRRNFFSKIGKGLLGIGIIKALPTPEVETVPTTPQNLSEKELDWTVPGQPPVGIVEFENELYIVEPADGSLNSLPDGLNPKGVSDVILCVYPSSQDSAKDSGRGSRK